MLKAYGFRWKVQDFDGGSLPPQRIPGVVITMTGGV